MPSLSWLKSDEEGSSGSNGEESEVDQGIARESVCQLLHLLAYGDDDDGSSHDGKLYDQASSRTMKTPNRNVLRTVLRVIVDSDGWMTLRDIKIKSDCSKTAAALESLYWERRALVRMKKGRWFLYRAGYQAARLIKEWERQ